MTKPNKAIILLNISSSSNNHKLARDIINHCRNHNLSVIKTIQTKGNEDCYALHKLLHKICSWHAKPITIIIDKNFLKVPINTLTCSVLGTLAETGLIKICTFDAVHTHEESEAKISLHYQTTADDNLLYIATNYFKQLRVLNNDLAL